MLPKLLKSKKKGSVPDGIKLYAIGDIHGALEQLKALLGLIEKDADGLENATLIFLGDYVDRGHDSCGVLDLLIDLQTRQTTSVFLKGNHEAAMLDFLSDPEDLPQWLDWGGEETLASYNINPVGYSPRSLSTSLSKELPAPHLKFLKNLPLIHEVGDYLFVHAGLRPGVAIQDQTEEDLLWIRKRFHNCPAQQRPEKIVIHGHQPVKKPEDHGWRINVDTGAVWSGMLSAVVLEGQTRRFITT